MSDTQPNGLVEIPRSVLSMAVGMIDTVERVVVGDARVRTARRNAWEAICADRARALHQDEVRRLVSQLRVGSSPRSRASQASVGRSPRRRAARS
ncbi:hypothetical protein RB614_08565 [Phytohabitans sp. ZYX-F-186]|uniref:Uncharacterized protein n=1 Tax=Phytohabitans maris TaxID=3071409 RepID=A0ABU0ZBX9_9ACTN|nr:hypothetical protein [Phytohabitans sp. ZYX-F-186]MDQ7904575.1 hypothetical protein [Phytohabitans sp. ZYX-F-186]